MSYLSAGALRAVPAWGRARSPPSWSRFPATALQIRLGGIPREQKMLKGHLHRVIYHRVYSDTQGSTSGTLRAVPAWGRA